MSATIEPGAAKAPAVASIAAPVIAPPQALVPVPRKRPRPWSSKAADEQNWLQEGFAPPQPDLADYLAETPPQLLRNTHRLVAALFLALIALASVLKVDIVVTGTGRLAVDSPTIVLQPMQLSVVRQIRVKPGDTVRKGDLLASLDPTFTQADRAVLLAQQSAVRAQQARLEAELDGTAFDPQSGPPELMLQRSLHQQRKAQYDAKLADYAQRLRGYDADVATAQQNRALLTQQLALSRDVEGMRNALFRSQTGPRLGYVEAQAARVQVERELQSSAGQLNALQQAKLQLQADRQAFVDSWRRDLMETLVKTRADALAVDESLTKANLLNELVVLSAPEDGVVLEVAKRSVGSVLNAAEPLITMLPSDASLIAEIAIGSADVGYTKPGDVAAIKVDAFPYQRHGLLNGRLRSIGADSVAANGAAAGSSAYHRGQVVLDGTVLKGMPEGTRLIPGMTLAAELKVGSRTVISYLLYPILRSMNESIREP